VAWDEWITLPIRPQDNAVRTVRGPIRVPTVIVAVNFAKVPKKRPKLCARTIRERDPESFRDCQYTGRALRPEATQSSADDLPLAHGRDQAQFEEAGFALTAETAGGADGDTGHEQPGSRPDHKTAAKTCTMRLRDVSSWAG
jgi:hypothetical protein